MNMLVLISAGWLTATALVNKTLLPRKSDCPDDAIDGWPGFAIVHGSRVIYPGTEDTRREAGRPIFALASQIWNVVPLLYFPSRGCWFKENIRRHLGE